MIRYDKIQNRLKLVSDGMKLNDEKFIFYLAFVWQTL